MGIYLDYIITVWMSLRRAQIPTDVLNLIMEKYTFIILKDSWCKDIVYIYSYYNSDINNIIVNELGRLRGDIVEKYIIKRFYNNNKYIIISYVKYMPLCQHCMIHYTKCNDCEYNIDHNITNKCYIKINPNEIWDMIPEECIWLLLKLMIEKGIYYYPIDWNIYEFINEHQEISIDYDNNVLVKLSPITENIIIDIVNSMIKFIT